jgi:hypothetical protein
MSENWPQSSSDERDPRDDQEDEKKRDEQLESDRPPHHE